MNYAYKSLDVTGENVEGVISANSYDQAVSKIRENGLFILQLTPILADEDWPVATTELSLKIQQQLNQINDDLANKAKINEVEEARLRWEKRKKKSNDRFRSLMAVIFLCLINLIATVYAIHVGNKYMTILSFPISAFVCSYSIFSTYNKQQL